MSRKPNWQSKLLDRNKTTEAFTATPSFGDRKLGVKFLISAHQEIVQINIDFMAILDKQCLLAYVRIHILFK